MFAPWPSEQHIMGEVECPKCKNVTCKDCEGEGFQICDLGHSHDCETCDGDGVIRNRKCRCKGRGYIEGPARQQIGKQQIDIKYDRLIRALPGPVEWAANGAAILYRFDGGRGIVMAFSDNLENED